ncbi:MAG: acyl carrier protein [Lachnospiraceae bacterium]|nr:acyl carrier protein [Lachnospiraceae bacterium]
MVLEKLTTIIAEITGVHREEISIETTFMDDLGIDSLDVYQIIMGIEQEFGIEITHSQAETIRTVADALNLIKET